MEQIRKTKKAMQINGQYLEDLIPGFSTLNVTGRERLGVEINTTQRGMDDGAVYNYRRYQTRTLTVSFIINCGEFYESSAALQALNQLNAILDVENAQFIFDDEPDKYFVGTPGESSDIGISLGVVSGTFEIFCATPYKYSVEEYEARGLADGSFVINYNGSAKSYPKLHAKFYEQATVDEEGRSHSVADLARGDCGYVSFYTADKDIIQLGDPDEQDTILNAYSKSQSLLSQPFNEAGYSSAISSWARTGSVEVAKSYAAAIINPTSATVWSGWSYVEKPYVCHSVTLYSSNRRANYVDVTAVINTNLQYSGSWIGTGCSITGHLGIAGSWKHDINIKSSSSYWEGTATHTETVTYYNISVTEAQTSLGPIYFYVTTDGPSTSGAIGQVQCNNFAISSYGTDESDKYYVHPTEYSSDEATMLYTLPDDLALDSTGATDFTMTWKQKFCISNSAAGYKQYGGVMIDTLDSSNNIVTRVAIKKSSSGRIATVYLYADVSNGNPSLFKSYDIDCTYYNKSFGSSSSAVKTCSVTKSDKTITFNIAGKTSTFTRTTQITRKVKKVKITFVKTNNNIVEYNGLHEIKFVKDNCQTTKNVDNKFSANDVLLADCETGNIYLNNTNTPSLGALGNDWETFYLKPGLNQIGTSCSDWVNASVQAFSTSSTYNKGDVVTYNNKYYTCIETISTAGAWDASKWQESGGYAPEYRITYREVFL